MLLHDLVTTSQSVAGTSSRNAKVAQIAGLLKAADTGEVAILVAYLAGEPRQRKLGIGYAAVRDARTTAPAQDPTLTVHDVDDAFEQIATVPSGSGSNRERQRLLRALFERATADEQDFIARLVWGELRQGALEGIMLDAIARASGIDAKTIRRAHMFAGSLANTAEVALSEGAEGLARFGIELFRPLQPMLAQSADTVADALAQLGTAALEHKLDGARIQVHKRAAEVRVYSRNLNDVTAAVPEVVELTAALPAQTLVLDGEVIALKPNGRPHDFQVTMKRFGRKLDIDKQRAEMPLTPFFFDCLYHDGETLIDRPASERFIALRQAVGDPYVVQRTVTSDPDAAQAFMTASRDAGHEGIVAKALDAPYEAGRRGAAWLKVKAAVTLDLVVLGVEWGSGRRQGWLSNLHLGARDAENGGFVMLGKTFKGMTDELLAWQTQELLARETHRDAYTVYVRPELVVEIAFDDIQASTRYPGGLALRFARVKGYRPDKRADEADTIQTVRTLYENRR